MDDNLEYSDVARAAQDLFVSEYATHIFYVEDSDSEIFYERLFQRLFPRLPAFEVVCLHGKDNVRSKASEPQLTGLTYIFVVDKDFDDLLGASDDRLTYLDRYSIENYLADLDAIIGVVVEENPGGTTAQKVRAKCEDYINYRTELEGRLVEITRYFVVIRRRWLDLPTSKIEFDEMIQGASDWHPMPTLEWMTELREKVLAESGLLPGDLDLDLSEAFEPHIDFDEATTIPVFHVPGKHLLPSVLRYLGARTSPGFERKLGKSLYTRILNHVRVDEFAVLKGRLVAQHPNLVPFQ